MIRGWFGDNIINPIMAGWTWLRDSVWRGFMSPIAIWVDGLTKTLKDKLFNPIYEAVRSIYNRIRETLASYIDMPGTLMPALIDSLKDVVTTPLQWLAPVVDGAVAAWKETAAEAKATAVQMRTERRVKERMTSPSEREAPPVFDFRGSRFDIKQDFAEGFDPDRIAVAFTNDLAALGERRLQSGLAPLFSVR